MTGLRCRPPACYGPWPARRSIRYSSIAGWNLCAAGPSPEDKGPPWPRPVPEEPPTDTQVALWREKWAAECSDKVARLLCALEREYARD